MFRLLGAAACGMHERRGASNRRPLTLPGSARSGGVRSERAGRLSTQAGNRGSAWRASFDATQAVGAQWSRQLRDHRIFN